MDVQAIEAKIKAAKESARKKAEQAVLEARMALLEDENYLSTLVSIEAASLKQEKLESLIKACEQVTVENPIYDHNTRQNRKWAGRYVFEFGRDIELLYRLATGIQYASKEHRVVMLAVTGLDSVAVEEFVKAMGRPAYYSTRYNTVVEPIPFNASTAKAYALVLGDQLGLVLDTSQLTEERFTKYFNRELEKADLLKQEADMAVESPFTLD